ESLDANAEPVERDLGAITHRQTMQVVGFVPALQGQVAEYGAATLYSSRPTGQALHPFPPLILIEGSQGFRRAKLLLRFTSAKEFEQGRGCGVFGRSEAGYPLGHHLYIAKFSEAAEQDLPRLLHLFPGRVRIDCLQSVGDRAAAAHCYA